MRIALCFWLPMQVEHAALLLGVVALALVGHRRRWWRHDPRAADSPLQLLLSRDFSRALAMTAIEEAQSLLRVSPLPNVQLQSSDLPSQHWALLEQGVERARGHSDQLPLLTETLHEALRHIFATRARRALEQDRLDLPPDLDALTVCTAMMRFSDQPAHQVAGVLAECKRRHPEATSEELLQKVARCC